MMFLFIHHVMNDSITEPEKEPKAFHKTLMAVCLNKTMKALDPVAGFCYYTVISVNRNIFISLGK